MSSSSFSRSPSPSSSSISPNSFQFNRHREQDIVPDSSLLPLFFAKSPSAEELAIAGDETSDAFCSPIEGIEQPPSPTSYLVRPQEIQEENDDEGCKRDTSTSSDDFFSSEEADQSSSSNNRPRRRNSKKSKKQTLADLMKFESSPHRPTNESEEESISLLGNSKPLPGKAKPPQRPKPRHLRSKDPLFLVQGACGSSNSARDHVFSPKSRFSPSSSRRACNVPSPLRSSSSAAAAAAAMPRSKSSASFIPRSSSGRGSQYEVSLTKSKSLGDTGYVVRVDQTGRINQQRWSSGRRPETTTADSMATVMDRYQQRIKDEQTRKQSSSYLPYKRALLSLFVPLPSFWSHHHHNQQQHQNQQQLQQQHQNQQQQQQYQHQQRSFHSHHPVASS